jgi:hypothetical protein
MRVELEILFFSNRYFLKLLEVLNRLEKFREIALFTKTKNIKINN